MTTHKQLTFWDDPRTIKRLDWGGVDPGDFYMVGENNCVSIEAVRVAGQMGDVPWFEVKFKSGGDTAVNGATVMTIEFADGKKTSGARGRVQ